jgi:hypothetical protein
MADEEVKTEPTTSDDDSIPEDPNRVVSDKDTVLKSFGMAIVSLISKRFTLAEEILLATVALAFAIIFMVPDSRVQIAMPIFTFIGGFASAAVMFYLGNHNQAVQASLQAQLEELKAAQIVQASQPQK